MEIKVTNVNQALSRGLDWLRITGVKENSRNGPVIVSPEPVLTIYTEPRERVLFSPLRDANPFFHYLEALWMLAGRNDVAFPAYFAANIKNYSDDGETLHGAYGYRWRKAFYVPQEGGIFLTGKDVTPADQLTIIAAELKRNPESRRCVLQMWSIGSDLNLAVGNPNYGKDVPCNTHVYFDVHDGALNMTVLCRSNDILWGAYGANAVHFSILQEYLAARVGVPVGVYRQFSNNYHLYPGTCGIVDGDLSMIRMADDAVLNDAYERLETKPSPLVTTSVENFDMELARFMKDPDEFGTDYEEDSLRLAKWMYRAWKQRKELKVSGEIEVGNMPDGDWKLACRQWIDRRELPLRAEQHETEAR